MDVWVLTPGNSISLTTEEYACRLIDSSPGYGNYIFFFATLSTDDDLTTEAG
jgi:hypothetical protein